MKKLKMTPVRQDFLVAVSKMDGIDVNAPMTAGEVRTMRWAVKQHLAKITLTRRIVITPKGKGFLDRERLEEDKMVYPYRKVAAS